MWKTGSTPEDHQGLETNGSWKGVMDSIYVNGRSEGQRGRMDGFKRGESADVRAKWLETGQLK
ncbi:hypothetical protein PSHT_04705 [Puccinia striiformis]|uniref:Uncharacterized protein n=1 Tax=Puccinia striiformis TaxID=27350 RepID=A0A2S4WC96_9BASI|nr:hypothetical protein PSHT_04705 [Puccinia striiformis]